MNLKYGLEDRPSLKENLVYGMQWLAVTIPSVIILGKILGSMQGSLNAELLYMQKLFAVMAVSLLFQIWLGHRLPLVIGPATVLLIGILASKGSSPEAIYFTILICGIVLTGLAAGGLFAYLMKLFTPRVVAVILLLVAFTMMPTILNLISGSGGKVSSSKNLAFSFVFVMIMFAGQRFLSGLWKSTLILWAMIIGTLVFFLLNPGMAGSGNTADFSFFGGFFHGMSTSVILDPGLIIAFLLCFLALAINDLGSIQAVGSVLQADEMPKRITRGVTFTGISNILAGFMGVIGPLNYSFSPGIIASTGCAARRTLIPAGIAMLALAFMPGALFYLSFIPGVVIGCILLFIMCTQVAAGLAAAFSSMEQPYFDNALMLAFPLLTGILVAFMPGHIAASFPAGLRPVLANGFVMGVLVSLLMEHVILRPGKPAPASMTKE